MVRFENRQDKKNGTRYIICSISWEQSWMFEEFDVIAIGSLPKEEFSIKNIKKRNMISYEETIDINKLPPGNRYELSVFYKDNDNNRKRLPNTELAGDVIYDTPHNASVFFFIKNQKAGWKRLYVLVNGYLPDKSLMIRRGNHTFYLPNPPANGIIYTCRIKASKKEKTELISLVSLYKMQQTISLKELQAKVL